MTKQEYEIEFKKLVKWADKETEKISKEIQSVGLDTNKDKYKKIHDEYKGKLEELNKEYKG